MFEKTPELIRNTNMRRDFFGALEHNRVEERESSYAAVPVSEGKMCEALRLLASPCPSLVQQK